MTGTTLTKKLLKEATKGQEVLYLSKKVFDHKDLKPIDIRLLIVLSTLKGNTVESMRHFGNPLIIWITKHELNNSKSRLYSSLNKLKEKGLVDKEGYGLELKKDYIIFTEKELPLLNKFKNISQLFMISARIWNRNKTNQILSSKYLNSFLPSSRRTEYFNNLIKSLGLDKEGYGYFLDGNTFKKDLKNYTDKEKEIILSKKEKYKPITTTKTVVEESEGFKELMQDKNKYTEEDEVEFPYDSKISVNDYESTDFPY